MGTFRTGVVVGAVLSAAVLAAGTARGQGSSGAGEQPPEMPTPGGAPAAPEAEDDAGLLMSTLDRAGLADPLERAGIRIFGYVEGSYTHNPDPTNHRQVEVEDDAGPQTFILGDVNFDRSFDTEANQFLLNQVNLTAERRMRLNLDRFDFGFRTEVIYGADARWLHANGLNFYGPGDVEFGTNRFLQEHPENQFDLFQAYVDLSIPVGNGLGLRVGKFESLFGGTVDPNGNAFYSRSLIFATAHPFTFTGVLAEYRPVPDLRVEAGFHRGWDQALEDNNDAVSGLVRVSYLLGDRTVLGITATSGPEQPDNNSDYRTLVEATAVYRATDDLRLTLTGTYGHDARVPVITTSGEVSDEPDVRWYSVAGVASLDINKYVQFNSRLDFLRDEKGFVTGIAGNTVSGTLGLTLKPFPGDRIGRGLKIRPEVRCDYSDDKRYAGYSFIDPAGNVVTNNDANSQLTFAVDAIFNF